MQAADGYVYGTSDQAARPGQGVVFRFDPATSNLQVLHEFRGSDRTGSHGRPDAVE